MWKFILILIILAIGIAAYCLYKKQESGKGSKSPSNPIAGIITLIVFSIIFLVLGILCFVGQDKSIIGGIFGILGAIFFGYIAYQSYKESK